MPGRVPAANWLDYFSGGVPTGEYFRMMVSDLRELVDKPPNRRTRIMYALVTIGLVAYFEAFCKDHFASTLNIVPTLVRNLAARGQPTTIDIDSLGDDLGVIDRRLGFYIAESYDFGTARKINSAFNSLLTITPFTKAEAEAYDHMIHDRNLFVHHGGTYTTTYLKNSKGNVPKAGAKPFWDGLSYNAKDVIAHADLVEKIARKLMVASHKVTTAFVNDGGIRLGPERKKALNAFLWWGDFDQKIAGAT